MERLYKKIYFRTDASFTIGYGHFIRSLALAEMLQEDFECVIVTVNPTQYQINEINKVCEYISLPSDQSHFETFLQTLKGDEIVVLDNYFFTSDYQKAIKSKGSKLVCIDDLRDKHYFADLIIHQGISDPSMFSAEAYTKFCIGIDWVLLRAPFLKAYNETKSRPFPKSIGRIAVCFGGSDMNNITELTISALCNQKNITQIDIISNQNKSIFLGNDKIKLIYHQNISADKIVEIFTNCDLGILSTSTICLEALACHTLLAVGYYVDNQAEFYKYLTQNKMALGLGNLLNDKYLNELALIFEKFGASEISRFDFNFDSVKSRYIKSFNELCI